MTLPIIGTLIEAGLKIIDKVIPDPEAKAQAQIELLRLHQAGEFKEIDAQVALATAQTNINQAEASHPSVFVSGWRPAMGWVCVAVFAANFIFLPFLGWLSPVIGIPAPTRLDIGEVMPVLFGMLGLGSMRMTEKIKGVASK